MTGAPVPRTLPPPDRLPDDPGAALNELRTRVRLGLDDLKLMVLLECAAAPLYEELADLIGEPEAAELLRQNAREETAKAHRIKRAIERKSGECYAMPALHQNPYASRRPIGRLDRRLLERLRAAEHEADVQYQIWAQNEPDRAVAALLFQNSRDEIRHSERMTRVIELYARRSGRRRRRRPS